MSEAGHLHPERAGLFRFRRFKPALRSDHDGHTFRDPVARTVRGQQFGPLRFVAEEGQIRPCRFPNGIPERHGIGDFGDPGASALFGGFRGDPLPAFPFFRVFLRREADRASRGGDGDDLRGAEFGRFHEHRLEPLALDERLIDDGAVRRFVLRRFGGEDFALHLIPGREDDRLVFDARLIAESHALARLHTERFRDVHGVFPREDDPPVGAEIGRFDEKPRHTVLRSDAPLEPAALNTDIVYHKKSDLSNIFVNFPGENPIREQMFTNT